MWLWAICRRDSGGKCTVGVNGVFTTESNEEIKVWDLESAAAAKEATLRIEASHCHRYTADYFQINYSAGKMREMFKRENIQII